MLENRETLRKHEVSNRLMPHNIVSDELVKNGFLQLSNNNTYDSPNIHFLRQVRSTLNEKDIALSEQKAMTAHSVIAYSPKLKMIYLGHGRELCAINAKNGIVLWSITLSSSIYDINAISINRITEKLHLRVTLSGGGTYATYTIKMRDGTELTQLTGTQENLWGTFNYKENVFYNPGNNYRLLSKVDGTTGQLIVSLPPSSNLSIDATTKIKLDASGHVLVGTPLYTSLDLTLLDENLNVINYKNVSTGDKYWDIEVINGDIFLLYGVDYNHPNYPGHIIQQMELTKWEKYATNPSVTKLYNQMTSTRVTGSQSEDKVNIFNLNGNLFVAYETTNSFQNSGYWFVVRSSDLEVHANPMNWVSDVKYSCARHIPWYGKVGE